MGVAWDLPIDTAKHYVRSYCVVGYGYSQATEALSTSFQKCLYGYGRIR